MSILTCQYYVDSVIVTLCIITALKRDVTKHHAISWLNAYREYLLLGRRHMRCIDISKIDSRSTEKISKIAERRFSDNKYYQNKI